MATIQKTHLYKMYRSGTFLGILQNVTSPFTYSQDINSNAVQLNVEVDLSADVADIPVQPLQDEAGNNLLDEDGNILYEERAQDVVSSVNPASLIQENNNLKVYEISSDNINGKLVFDGYIEDWDALMGTTDDKVTFIAISNGVDLSDYLVEGASTTDVSQSSQNTSHVINNSPFVGPDSYYKLGQTFVVSSGITNISGFKFWLANLNGFDGIVVNVKLWNSASDYYGGGTPLATATQTLNAADSTPKEWSFSFSTPATVTPLATYFVSIEAVASDISGINVYYSNANPYANGSMWVSRSTVSSGAWTADTSSDLYFKTVYTSGATSTPFSSQDPSTILTTILTNYNAAGGVVTVPAAGYALTGNTTSYTFKVNTILEAVQKVLDLAPSDWYWYVDPATQILYFKQTPTTPTHTFKKGRHFDQINIGATVANVVNVLYFSGGDTGGGVNLFSKYTNSSSLATQGRRRLKRLSDNRVTVQATADLIAANELALNSGVKYSSPVRIDATTYDITLINVGDTVKLEGFGNFADTLTLQIARLVRNPDYIDITLGVVLQRQSDALTQALSDLDKLQTVANPSAPS